MNIMKVYENGKNWIIEDQLDCNLVKEISEILKENVRFKRN